MYATAKEFCLIFAKEMPRLYLLALLLTGDEQRAERCFIAAFHDCLEMDSVFKNFAQSWSRRAIIKNAIRMTRPEINHRKEDDHGPINNQLGAVIRLETLERFVFVISILERYSDHECSILLNRTRADVIHARAQALKHLDPLQPVELLPLRTAIDRDACSGDPARRI